ncbi:radical SAM/SPASM domain-containing protein [Methanolacinia paynteri]|uniref:radical SAM/SPASM domain-containing protein n=1 Tax=Methanolacinia paynteri TaxID=230356 RepID=UPI00064FEFC0|nr:radical SAM protein [Methanolacinia paynteri]
MNRITQCLHGSGTVSEVLKHGHGTGKKVPGKYLAFSGMLRPVVFWNLTTRCNLSCVHCYNSSGSRSSGELSTEEAIAVIDDLSGMGVPLILFSGGEPLLREDIWDLAAYTKDKGIITSLSSNGTLIDAEVAGKIKESGIGYVGISLDGAKPRTHNRFRGSSDAFSRTIDAFGHCRDAEVRTGVRVTLTKANFRELDDLIDLALFLGASRFCLYWLVPSGRGTGDYERLQLNGDEVTEALGLLYGRAKEIDPSVMEFLTVDAPQDAIHLLASMRKDESEDLEDAESLVASLNGGCSAGSKVANISHQGFVYPCQFAQSEEFFVGDVRKTPFSRIWNDDSNPVLSLFRNKGMRFTGGCGECMHRELCGGGCMVRAYYTGKDFSAEDPFCFLLKGEGSLD